MKVKKIQSKFLLLFFLTILILIGSVYALKQPQYSISSLQSKPYCDVPSILVKSLGAEINERTIVYTGLSQLGLPSIFFYDLGNDSIKSNDDLGVRQPFAPLNMTPDYSPHIWGNTVVFVRLDLITLRRSVIIYDIGPDKIAGTQDDVGPTIIYSAAPRNDIKKLSIKDNLVVFESYNGFLNSSAYFMCTADPQGTCWTSQVQQIITSSNNTKQKIIGTNFNSQPTFFWEEEIAGNKDIYFKDNNQEGAFFNESSYEQIEDVSGTYFVFSERPLINSASSKIGFGIVGAPLVKLNISNYNSFADTNPRIARNPGINNEFLVSWIRRNGTRFTYMVSNIYSGKEINVRFKSTNSYGTPQIDKNTLIFDDGRVTWVTNCFF